MKLEVEALPGLPEPGARLRLLAWAKPLKVALFSLRQEYSAVCSRVGGGQLVATIGAEIRCGEREKVWEKKTHLIETVIIIVATLKSKIYERNWANKGSPFLSLKLHVQLGSIFYCHEDTVGNTYINAYSPFGLVHLPQGSIAS